MDLDTKATATMHVKVIRANGHVEEITVPVTTELTKQQVRDLIEETWQPS